MQGFVPDLCGASKRPHLACGARVPNSRKINVYRNKCVVLSQSADSNQQDDKAQDIKDKIIYRLKRAPVIGLLWSITSPYGIYGLYTQEFYQFQRYCKDNASYQFWRETDELEDKYGRAAELEYLQYPLFVGRQVLGVLTPSYLMSRMRKLRVRRFLEAEIEETVLERAETMESNRDMQWPDIDQFTRAQFMVDSMVVLVIGKKATEPVDEADAKSVATLVSDMMDEVSLEEALEMVQTRAARAKLYQ